MDAVKTKEAAYQPIGGQFKQMGPHNQQPQVVGV